MSKSFVFSVAFALLCAAACGGGGGGGGPTGIGVRDLNGDGRVEIVCFGDSITAGIGDNDGGEPGDPENGGYPARLQNLLSVNVINAGEPGERTFQGRSRLPGVLAQNRADYVILLEGVNDLEFGDPDPLGNIQEMLDAIVGSGAVSVVGLLTPSCCNHRNILSAGRIENFNAALATLALDNLAPVIDFHSAFGVGPADSADPTTGLIHVPEGLHPTPAGYDAMAAAAAEAFKPGVTKPKN